MKEEEKNTCMDTCTCGCQEGMECTCEDVKCTCGCEEGNCTCDDDCTCGCQDNKSECECCK